MSTARRTVKLKVLDDGFDHAGIRYKSLSKIARVITGTPWNGFAFFGLERRTATSMEALR